MKKSESEKHKSCGMPAEEFKGHVATDGSLLGMAGKWRACGWTVAELDIDEELGPLRGMCGSFDAELEVQRTIKRVELTAFPCLRKKVIGPVKVNVDNEGIIDGLWRGGRKRIDSKAGDADLWIKNCKGLHLPTSKEISVDVEHAKAHRTEKGQERDVAFEKFVTDGNEMSWQRQERCWMMDSWRRYGQTRFNWREKKCM